MEARWATKFEYFLRKLRNVNDRRLRVTRNLSVICVSSFGLARTFFPKIDLGLRNNVAKKSGYRGAESFGIVSLVFWNNIHSRFRFLIGATDRMASRAHLAVMTPENFLKPATQVLAHSDPFSVRPSTAMYMQRPMASCTGVNRPHRGLCNPGCLVSRTISCSHTANLALRSP